MPLIKKIKYAAKTNMVFFTNGEYFSDGYVLLKHTHFQVTNKSLQAYLDLNQAGKWDTDNKQWQPKEKIADIKRLMRDVIRNQREECLLSPTGISIDISGNEVTAFKYGRNELVWVNKNMKIL